GNAAVLDPADARIAAKKRLAQVGLGHDPQAEKVEARRRASVTLANIVERYLADKAGKIRRSSLAAASRYLRDAWRPLHGIPIDKIQRHDVKNRLDEIVAERGAIVADGAR